MSAAKHTPWAVADGTPGLHVDGRAVARVVVDKSRDGGNGRCVAYAFGPTETEREQRARLIAAAPELLEALIALLPYLSDQAQLLDGAACNEGRASGFDVASVRARAALAKAEGRS